MRSRRLALILLAVYFVFVGGSAYYSLFFPVRVFHHVFVTLLLSVWLFGRWRARRGLPLTPLNAPLYAAVGVWLVTSAASIDARMAFENSWFPITHTLMAFVLVDWIQRGRQRLVMEAQFMIAALVVFVTGLEIASWYFGLGITPGTAVGWIDVIGPGAWLPLIPIRVSLALNISTLLAGYVAPLITLALGWSLTVQRSFRYVLWLLAAGLAVALALTFSRGGMISLAAGLGVLLVLRATDDRRVASIVPVRVIFALALLAGIAATVVLIKISAEPVRQYGDEGRMEMWSGAAQMTAAHPLTGVGPGIFGRAFRDYRVPDHAQEKLVSAHNAYLNLAAETGLPGVIVGGWLAATVVVTWIRRRRAATGHERVRLDVAFAALVGLGVHSLVDNFTVTPIVLLMALLAALIVAEPRVGFEEPPSDRRVTSLLALGLVLAFGLWLVYLDVAQSHYQNSLRGGESALAEAELAARLDPGMRLYALQAADLTARAAPDLDSARAAYRQALDLERGWDTGWINLAGFDVRANDPQAAFKALTRARAINPQTSATVHWAQLAEQLKAVPDDEIVDAYYFYMTLPFKPLPMSAFWTETPLRRAALERYIEASSSGGRYRILMAFDPDRAATVVPSDPTTASDWSAVGQAALAKQEFAAARQALTTAIQLAPDSGDLYVLRARAELHDDPAAARRDLDLSGLLVTAETRLVEYPNAVRAEMATAPDEVYRLRASALPPRTVQQEFAAVLYGRVAGFDLLPEMRDVGPGYAIMKPWYDIAADYLAAGQTADAANVYRAILDYAPDETTAREKLAAISPS